MHTKFTLNIRTTYPIYVGSGLFYPNLSDQSISSSRLSGQFFLLLRVIVIPIVNAE